MESYVTGMGACIAVTHLFMYSILWIQASKTPEFYDLCKLTICTYRAGPKSFRTKNI